MTAVYGGPGVYVTLFARPSDGWTDDEIWTELEARSTGKSPYSMEVGHDVDDPVAWIEGVAERRKAGKALAMQVAYRQAEDGPSEVEVFAVLDGLGVRWRLAPADGPAGPVDVREVRIHSRDGRPVGRKVCSRLGLGRVYDALTLALTDPGASAVLGDRWGAVEAPRPGRRGRPDLHYARVALDYVRALEQAPRSPVRHMVASADEPGVTEDELRARLRRARRRGLLTDAPKGQPGGELTDKAKALLRGAGLYEGD